MNRVEENPKIAPVQGFHRCACGASVLASGSSTAKEAPKVKKSLIITSATAVLIVLAAAAALFTLSAVAGSHQTCGKVNPTELRRAGDPSFPKKLEKLARCEK
jgi:hypothetical protein